MSLFGFGLGTAVSDHIYPPIQRDLRMVASMVASAVVGRDGSHCGNWDQHQDSVRKVHFGAGSLEFELTVALK